MSKLFAAILLFTGCTALVAAVSNNSLTVANVGDSRGVLCDKNGNAIPISFDHKPQNVRIFIIILLHSFIVAAQKLQLF